MFYFRTNKSAARTAGVGVAMVVLSAGFKFCVGENMQILKRMRVCTFECKLRALRYFIT